MAHIARLGPSVALVEQDYLRRIVLKERDIPCGANIGLISNTTRYALEHGWNVILDGILSSKRYTGILDELHRDHLGTTYFYYFDVSWDETVLRHRTRPKTPRLHQGSQRHRRAASEHRKEDLP